MKISKTMKVYLTIILATVMLANFSFFWNYKFYETDFLVFYSATKLLVQDHNALYLKHYQAEIENSVILDANVSIPRVYGPFVNVPLVLVPFLPVVNLHPQLAFHIMGTIFYIFTALIIILFKKLITSKLNFIDFLICFTFIPVFVMAVATQSTLLFLYALYFSLFFLNKEEYFKAGFSASFLWVSPQLALLISIWLLINSYKKGVLGYLAGLSTFIFANLIVARANIHIIKSFMHHFYWYSTYYEQSVQRTFTMVSLQGLLAQISEAIVPFNSYTLAGILSAIIVLATSYFLYKKKRTDNYLGLAIALVAGLLSGMHIHFHSAAVLIVVYLICSDYFKSAKFNLWPFLGWVIFGLAFYTPNYPHHFYFVPTIYLICLWGVLVRKNKSAAILRTQLDNI